MAGSKNITLLIIFDTYVIFALKAAEAIFFEKGALFRSIMKCTFIAPTSFLHPNPGLRRLHF